MAFARQCDRCKLVVEPRGRHTAKFCPQCGARLTGAPVERGDSYPFQNQKTSGRATASLVFGILAIIVPVFGVFFGLLAIGLGFSTKERIRRAPHLRGNGAAGTGIALGVIGVAIQLVICRGMH